MSEWLEKAAKRYGWTIEERDGHKIISGVVPLTVPDGIVLGNPSLTLDEMSKKVADPSGN